jgi:LysR family glycine cleavage system transcriptional activator
MLRDLPFTALRTFGVVAHLPGFERTAEGAGVTQSAVSQQVKALESWLGMRNLERGGVQATTTEPGAAGRCDRRRARSDGGTVPHPAQGLGRAARAGHLLPAGVRLFLAYPAADRFRPVPSGLSVSIAASAALAAFTGDDTDLAIRYGLCHYPSLDV